MIRIEAMAGENNNNNNEPPQPPNGGRPPLPPPAAGGEGGRNGENPPPQEPERLRMPENPHSPEFELFGRFLVEEIIRLDAQLKEYEQAYRETPGLIATSPEFDQLGCYLDKLFAQLKAYRSIVYEQRSDLIPRDYADRYRAQAEQAAGQPAADQPQQAEQAAPQAQGGTEYQQARDRNELAPLAELLTHIANPAERATVESQLLIYLREAKRKGLLTNTTSILDATFHALESSNYAGAPEDFINNRLRVARASAAITYAKRQNEPGMRELNGIWEFYIILAGERLNNILRGREQETKEGEWDPTKAKEENHWRASSYPEYYEVTATTKEQFERAKDTFLQMIKQRGLGLGPETVFAHLENFRKAFGRQAAEMAQQGNVSYEFARNIRLELEGLSYLWGADYANEVYNPEQYKQFMTAMALHEGPERWTMVARSGEGRVAVSTWKWDKDARLNLYHNPCGSRGQLSDDTVTQNYLQEQIWQIMVEENMGVVMKDYDPRLGRPNPATDTRTDAERGEGRQKNINRIGIYQPDEAFQNLYEGFERRNADGSVEKGFAHKDNWRRYGVQPEGQWPKHLVDSIRIGKVQIQVEHMRNRVRNGERGLFNPDKPKQTVLERLRELNDANGNQGITDEELTAYKEAFDKANDSFNVAFQMIGVSGEKVRRGGGVFYVDRNIYIQAYERLERIEDKLLSREKRRDKRIGKVLLAKRTPETELDDSKRNPDDGLTDQEFYDSLSPQEQMDYVDHMPVYIAEKFVQFAENWTKMKYGDDSDIWGQPGFLERVRDIPNFRAKYRAEMMKEARIRAARQIKRNGFQAQLKDADYSYTFIDKELIDEFKKGLVQDPHTGKALKDPGYLSGRKEDKTAGPLHDMTVKTPTGEIDPETGKMRVTEIVDKPVDFQTTQTHWLSRWTSHTYFFYQQENRNMLLDPRVRAQAAEIKAGRLRPEDANQLAVFLLILDPSLRRLKRLPGEQAKEIEMVGAAVEESFQSHTRNNRNLHRLFLPVDGNVHKMRMGYNREDYGGSSRFAMRIRDLVASQPRRFARRGAALIADMPMEISSMPDMWGAEGMMGAICMFADPIRPMAAQGVASQFAITKFIDQMGYGWELFGALVGKLDGREVVDKEGLYEKPTNNADKLQKLKQKGFNVQTFVEDENDMFYAFVEAFGRLGIVLKILRVMGKARNAEGLLWAEDKDIFLTDGSYNPELARDRNVGTSRHSAKIFYDTFIDWLTSTGPGSGSEAYPDEAPLFGWLNLWIIADKDKPGKKRRIRDWLWDKMGR